MYMYFKSQFLFVSVPTQGDFSSHDDDKAGNKPKLKRGLFGKSSKRKPNSRPSSEFIACEMTTMSEEDRINLMRNVKSGDLSVDQALKRFIRCEMIFFTVL